MKAGRSRRVKIFFAVLAVLGTPVFAIWGGYERSKHDLRMAWINFKQGFTDWFRDLKKIIRNSYKQEK